MSEFFDALAPGYDDNAFHPLVAEALINGLTPEPSLLVDVATGTGAAAFAALRLSPGSVLAVDISPAMIKLAAAKVPSLDPDGRISWQVGPGVPLPLEDGSADAVVCASALHFLGPAALADWRRVLRPGGQAAFSVPSVHRFQNSDAFADVVAADLQMPGDLAEAAALATAAGFREATADTVTSTAGDRTRSVFVVHAVV
ncbi:class I SAM-dependent methyltransferase [Amycolatopsis sp. NBC_00345]|uniref:class I SAM-dependent methyltransferase n=1 Tax=Amycolatopsis sp. NBC_00345 TaxID=2975955 RepID=UPI002E265A1F